jgi:hypothetical protein
MELYENSFTSDVAYCLKYIKEWGIKNKIYGFDGFDKASDALDVKSYELKVPRVVGQTNSQGFLNHSIIC